MTALQEIATLARRKIKLNDCHSIGAKHQALRMALIALNLWEDAQAKHRDADKTATKLCHPPPYSIIGSKDSVVVFKNTQQTAIGKENKTVPRNLDRRTSWARSSRFKSYSTWPENRRLPTLEK